MTRRFIAWMLAGALLGLAPAQAQDWVQSSIKYTEGTEALGQGNWQLAADLLAEAVRLDPTLSRNHGNYAAALFELNRLQEGWPHARKAVLLDPTNEQAQNNSRRYIKKLLGDANLDTGATLQQVVAVLGEPDKVAEQGKCVWYQYGVSALCFEKGVFSSIGNVTWRPNR